MVRGYAKLLARGVTVGGGGAHIGSVCGVRIGCMIDRGVGGGGRRWVVVLVVGRAAGGVMIVLALGRAGGGVAGAGGGAMPRGAGDAGGEGAAWGKCLAVLKARAIRAHVVLQS